MVSEKIIIGSGNPVRGRPFTKGNVKGKPTERIKGSIDDQMVVRGGDIAQSKDKSTEAEKTALKPKIDPIPEKDTAPVLVDQIIFKDDKGNEVKVCLFSTKTRHFRMQVFLNEKMELRPTTFTGNNAAMSFWELFKKNLRA
jgi:hypothetical protein